MRRPLAAVLGLVLTVGVWTVGATATAATNDVVHMAPAPTSVDRVPGRCDVPPAPEIANPTPGATVITFTILPRGC